MAGIKTTYGKRSKKATAFCSMTDLFTSPTEQHTEPRPTTYADKDLEYCIEALDTLQLEADRKKDRKKLEWQQRALQPVDSNVSRSPYRQSKAKQTLGTTIIDHETTETATSPKVSGKQTTRTGQGKATTSASHERGHASPINEGRPTSRAKVSEKRITSMLKIPSSDRSKHPSTSTRICESKCSKSRNREPQHVMVKKSQRSDPYAHHTRGLLRLCSDPERRSAPQQFSTWAANLEPLFNVIKIAEASYGEVYRLAHKVKVPGFSKQDESVFKMIALKPPTANRPQGKRRTKKDRELEERVESMSSVKSVLSEVQLLRRMSEVPGFTNFREIHVLQGVPSDPFVTAWRDWNEARPEEKQSIFADPGVEGSYDETQLWAVIEMYDAGSDLEERDMETIGGVFGIWDIFWGVTLALGKGEEDAHFEHRDLHMGNICIRPMDTDRPIAAPSSAPQLARKLNFTGLETTLIDYTLSRAQLTSPSRHPEPSLSDIAYEDLEPQEWLFEADASEDYQYEIYRYMRGAVFLDDPLADVDARAEEVKAIGRTWAGFHPQTNLMWLHFLLHEMMRQMTPIKKSKSKGRTTKKKGARKVDASFENLLVEKKQELERILKKVQTLLDPEYVPKSGVWSTKDLIRLAIEEGWLDEKDVIAGDDNDVGNSLVDVVEELDGNRASSPMTQTADLLRASWL